MNTDLEQSRPGLLIAEPRPEFFVRDYRKELWIASFKQDRNITNALKAVLAFDEFFKEVK